MNTPQNDRPSLTTVLGGEEIPIRYTDGREELVKVKQLSVRDMQRYLTVLDDELKSVELFCGKPDGWADSLTPDSHVAIMEKGQELNLPFFKSWFQRRQARTEVLIPGITKRLENTASSVAEKLVKDAAAAGKNGADTMSTNSVAS